MSKHKEDNDSVELWTISKLLKLISTILDVKIKRNQQVIEARSITKKFTRFNANVGKKIIEHLLGIISTDFQYNNFITASEKIALEEYKKRLVEQFELTEIIISSIQNKFLYQKYQIQEQLIEYLIVPFMTVFNDFNKNLPRFVPITHLIEIVVLLYLSHTEKTTTVLKKYLRNKAASLISNDQKNRTYEIFNSIDNIKSNSIPSAEKIYEYTIKFSASFSSLKSPQNNNKISLIMKDFMGAFFCCSILLRLESKINNPNLFKFLLKSITNYASLYQLKYYENNKHPIFNISKDNLDKCIIIYENQNNSEHLIMMQEVLEYFGEMSGLTNNNELINSCDSFINFFLLQHLSVINKILMIPICFNPIFSNELTQFINEGINYDQIKNKNKLQNFIQELDSHNEVYITAIKCFINSIISILSGKIDQAIYQLEKIVENESKKWHLGKLKSDSLVLYIPLKKIKKELSYSKLCSLLTIYVESKPSELTLELLVTDIKGFDQKMNNIKKLTDNKIIDISILSLFNSYNKFISKIGLMDLYIKQNNFPKGVDSERCIFLIN